MSTFRIPVKLQNAIVHNKLIKAQEKNKVGIPNNTAKGPEIKEPIGDIAIEKV